MRRSLLPERARAPEDAVVSCSWMEPIVDDAHAPLEDVCVDLRGGQIGVSEHHLDGAQIGAPLEQMRRKRVSQHVRADRSAQPRLPDVRFQDLPETYTRQARSASLRVDEQSRTTPLAKQHRA